MIEVKDVVKYYGDFLAVDRVNFTINQGEIIGLLGPNGAGKSTTIRMICGYLTPQGGHVTINGVDSLAEPLMAKKTIGYLPESAPLYDDMLVYDYLFHVGRIRQISTDKVNSRLQEVAKVCGLVSVMHKNIGELSKGFRQRVGLAHALIGDPDILVLDEPTSGLDPNQIVEIRHLIKEIGKTKTIIICSHILPEVEATCDRIIIISQGRVVADSSKEDLKKTYRGKTISLELDLPSTETEYVKRELLTISGIAKITDESRTKVSLKIHYEDVSDLRREIFEKVLKHHWMVLDFHQQEESLESIFRELTQNNTQKEIGFSEVGISPGSEEGVSSQSTDSFNNNI